MENKALAQADMECNQLLKQLEVMKAAKQDSTDNPAYMELLYRCAAATKSRLSLCC